MCRPAHEAPGAPYADTRLFVPREGVMLHLEQWARVRARTNCQLRRGAWYRVVELAPLDVVLEVNRRPLRVPRPFVQVIPIRPRLWSVVARLRNAAAPPQDWGPDRKSTRLNSSHSQISYAVFCLKKKKKKEAPQHPITDIKDSVDTSATSSQCVS